MEGLTIRPLDTTDTEAVARIARQSPEAAEWPVESYGRFPAWVVEEAGRVAGFVVARAAADELEILSIAVDPSQRGRGIGDRLIAQALSFGRSVDARRAFLEVRLSNAAAQKFYERHGFRAVGRRLRYYREPVEDALVMKREIDASG